MDPPRELEPGTWVRDTRTGVVDFCRPNVADYLIISGFGYAVEPPHPLTPIRLMRPRWTVPTN